jgi:hypothetical protein
MTTFGDLYEPLAEQHFADGVDVCPGATYRTHAWVDVPSVSGALPRFARPNQRAEHWSDTRAETIPTIQGLIAGVLQPAWMALPEVVAALATGVFDIATVAFSIAGVRGGKARGTASMQSTVEGVDPIVANVEVDAPAAAQAAVRQMLVEYLIPAIRLETGLR